MVSFGNLFSSSKCILLVGDDGVSVYETADKNKFHGSVFWQSPEFQGQLLEILERIGENVSVTILYNMIEQHYRSNQKLPKNVAFFDQSKLLENKLRAAFPNLPIRAHKALQGSRNNSYLFASIPFSDQLKRLFNVLEKSLMPVEGLCLLPVEMADLVELLVSKTFYKKKRVTKGWRVLIGQGEAGGLRQIVVRDGELALTRLTSVSDLSLDPESWAADVGKEFSATLSYLARYGYEPNDQLDLIVISDEPAHKYLGRQFGSVENIQCLTMQEAARIANVSPSKVEHSHYVDEVFVGWLGKKKVPALSMPHTLLEAIQAPKKLYRTVAFGLMLLLIIFGYKSYSFTQEAAVYEAQQETVQRQISSANSQYDKRWADLTRVSDDPVKLYERINALEKLQNIEVPWDFYKSAVGSLMRGDDTLQSIKIHTENSFEGEIYGEESSLPSRVRKYIDLTFKERFSSAQAFEQRKQEKLNKIRAELSFANAEFLEEESRLPIDTQRFSEVLGLKSRKTKELDENYIIRLEEK